MRYCKGNLFIQKLYENNSNIKKYLCKKWIKYGKGLIYRFEN